jgi:hypothetical protein
MEIHIHAGNAVAVYLDGDRTLEFTGKAQALVSIRLQDSKQTAKGEL